MRIIMLFFCYKHPVSPAPASPGVLGLRRSSLRSRNNLGYAPIIFKYRGKKIINLYFITPFYSTIAMSYLYPMDNIIFLFSS